MFPNRKQQSDVRKINAELNIEANYFSLHQKYICFTVINIAGSEII